MSGEAPTVLLGRRSGHDEVHTVVVMVLALLPLFEAGSLPPETDAVLLTLPITPKAADTSTLKVIGLALVVPALITVLLVQLNCVRVDAAQFQPVPAGVPLMVRPEGMVSVTVMVPLVFALPNRLLTVSVYVPPGLLTTKVLAAAFTICKSGLRVMVTLA